MNNTNPIAPCDHIKQGAKLAARLNPKCGKGTVHHLCANCYREFITARANIESVVKRVKEMMGKKK